MSFSGTCWLFGEVWFRLGMEAFGWTLVNLCSLESGVFWCSQVLDLSLLTLAFSLILTVASRLLHPYSTDDKTSRLMVKRFPTVRDTQRGLQSYMENRRGRREIEVTRMTRGGIKRRESNLAHNQFPMCLPQSRTPREVYIITQRREEGGGRQRWPGGEEGVKRGESNLASNQFPKCSP